MKVMVVSEGPSELGKVGYEGALLVLVRRLIRHHIETDASK